MVVGSGSFYESFCRTPTTNTGVKRHRSPKLKRTCVPFCYSRRYMHTTSHRQNFPGRFYISSIENQIHQHARIGLRTVENSFPTRAILRNLDTTHVEFYPKSFTPDSFPIGNLDAALQEQRGLLRNMIMKGMRHTDLMSQKYHCRLNPRPLWDIESAFA